MSENSIVGEQPPLKSTDENVIIFQEVDAELSSCSFSCHAAKVSKETRRADAHIFKMDISRSWRTWSTQGRTTSTLTSSS